MYKLKFTILSVVALFLFSLQASDLISNFKENKNGINISFDFSNDYDIKTIKLLKNYQKLDFKSEYVFTDAQYPEFETFKSYFVFSVPKGAKPDFTFSKSQSINFKKTNYIRAKKSDGKEFKSFDYVNPPLTPMKYNISLKPHLDFIESKNGQDCYQITYFLVQEKKNRIVFYQRWDFSINYGKSFNFIAQNNNKNSSIDDLNYRTSILNKKDSYRISKKFTTDNFLKNRNNQWLKIKNDKEGILKITGKTMEDKGFDLSVLKIENIEVYSAVANDFNSLDSYNDLKEYDLKWNGSKKIKRTIVDNNKNGFLDSDDYLLFYVQSSNIWNRDKIGLKDNDYSNYTYYWINPGIGENNNQTNIKELNQTELETTTKIAKVNSLQYFIDKSKYAFHFNNNVATYFTSEISTNNILELTNPNIEIDDTDNLTIRFKQNVLDSGFYSFNLLYNNLVYSLNSSSYTSILNKTFSVLGSNINSSSTPTFRIKCNGTFRLDYLYYDFPINFTNMKLNKYHLYYDFENQGNYSFLTSKFSNYYFFDVSNPYDYQGSLITNSDIKFSIDDTSKQHHYLLIDKNEFHSAVSTEIYDPREDKYLHNMQGDIDYLVVVGEDLYDIFLQEGNDFLASVKFNNPEVKTIKIVNIKTIYNEFGQGYQQPEVLRNALVYLYGNHNLKYSLLVGGGHFDYKNISNFSDPNYIYPPNYKTLTKGSDTYYANFIYSAANLKPKVAIGRFPVKSISELRTVLIKNTNYNNNVQNIGSWRNSILLGGDDEHSDDSWSEKFVESSEYLFNYSIPKTYYTDKLYLTEFPFVKDPLSGLLRKPAANKELIRKLNLGTALFLFTGHGSALRLAHEYVFDYTSLPQLSNSKNLAFFIAASCDVGVYSYPSDLGTRPLFVKLFSESQTGSIGSIAATGPTYQGDNDGFYKYFIRNLLDKSEKNHSVGESFNYAHQKSTFDSSDVSNYYCLVGNPALIIFNDKDNLTSVKDDFKSLTLDSISFSCSDNQNLKLKQFFVSFYEDGKDVIYQNLSHSSTFSLKYKLASQKIFSSKAILNDDNQFLKLIIPKDINYNENTSKIFLYGLDEDSNEYTGFIDSVSIKSGSTLNDVKVPQIDILFNSINYKDGDPIGTSPIIFIKYEDENGINTSGTVGHKLFLEYNGESIEMNNYFEYAENSYQKGYAKYQLLDLKDGSYNFKASGWDTSNNYNEITKKIKIENLTSGSNKLIGNLLNYPNPMRKNGTTFTFSNLSTVENSLRSYKIDIYTINGRKIKTIRHENLNETSFNIVSHFWDGLDSDYDHPANGVYIYKLSAKFSKKTIIKKGKLLIAR